MPYTISFEEARQIRAHRSAICSITYPQVTVVGSELGRPDDGTDPTGFFNCEFYVGLKPYNDKSWSARLASTPRNELIEDLEKKLDAYPGVIFNFTQPAEDAVDEALTGLKIRSGRENLRPRPRRPRKQSRRDQEHSRQNTRLHRTHRRARTRPAQSDRRCRPRQKSRATASTSPTSKPSCRPPSAARPPRR